MRPILEKLNPLMQIKPMLNWFEPIFIQTYSTFSKPLWKPKKFIEQVLLEIDSIEPLKYFPEETLEEQAKYQKIKNLKIRKPEEWPVKGYQTQIQFKIPFKPAISTYHDYIKVWCYIFYFKPFSHSWFIQLHPTITHDFSRWFYIWWKDFGGNSEIMCNSPTFP